MFSPRRLEIAAILDSVSVPCQPSRLLILFQEGMELCAGNFHKSVGIRGLTVNKLLLNELPTISNGFTDPVNMISQTPLHKDDGWGGK